MNEVGEVLIPADRIRSRVRELGKKISQDYEGEDLLVVGILKGAFVFLADLIREISIPLSVDFLGVSSYGAGTRSSEEIKVFKDLNQPVDGRNLLMVDDIIDSGLTTDYLVRLLTVRGPRSIKICSLLNKTSRRKVEIHIDYIGFEVSDRFVVGYGLDINEMHRHLPDIHNMKQG